MFEEQISSLMTDITNMGCVTYIHFQELKAVNLVNRANHLKAEILNLPNTLSNDYKIGLCFLVLEFKVKNQIDNRRGFL